MHFYFSINFFFIGLTKAEQNIGIKFIQKKYLENDFYNNSTI